MRKNQTRSERIRYFKFKEEEKKTKTRYRPWRKPKYKYNNELTPLSLIKKLREQKKSNEEFEIMLNNLTLEELIGIKLELASKSLGDKFFGLPIYENLVHVVKAAVLYYTASTSNDLWAACSYLGKTQKQFRMLLWLYGIDRFFEIDKYSKYEKWKINESKKVKYFEDMKKYVNENEYVLDKKEEE